MIAALIFLGLQINSISALYYGTPTSKIQESGYMIAEIGVDSYGLCGVNFLSSKTAVTAAHCLDGATKAYLHTGLVKSDYFSGAPEVESLSMSPYYSDYGMSIRPGANDVGIIVLSDSVSLSSYAQITTPQVGCDYYLGWLWFR